MKKTIQISGLLFLFLVSLTGYSQVTPTKTITEPVAYNDYIVNQQNLIGKNLLSFIDVFSDTTASKNDAIGKLNIVILTASDAIDNMNSLKTYDPDFGLKQSALNLFSFYKRVLGTTYFSILDEVYSAQPDSQKVNDLVASITEEEAGFDKAYAAAQEKFAAANNFTLEENELEEKFNN